MVVIKEGLQVEDLNQQIAILKLWERQYQGEFDKASGQWKKVSGHRLDITKGALKNLLALKGAIEQDRHPTGPDAGPQGPTGDPGPPEGAFAEEVALEKALHPDEFGGEDFPSERPVPGAGLISQLEKNSDEKGGGGIVRGDLHWTDSTRSRVVFIESPTGAYLINPKEDDKPVMHYVGPNIGTPPMRHDDEPVIINNNNAFSDFVRTEVIPSSFDVSELEKKVQDFAEYLYPGDLGHQVLVAEVILEWFKKNKP